MVAFLRYAESSLLGRLATRLGEGVVTSVDITLPGRD
jgi:hypothetical protein